MTERDAHEQDDEDTVPLFRCVMCGVLVDRSTGFIVGYPQRFLMCGRHARESIACMRWATGRMPKKGRPDFYEHAARDEEDDP